MKKAMRAVITVLTAAFIVSVCTSFQFHGSRWSSTRLFGLSTGQSNPVLWDGESRGKSTVLVNRGAALAKKSMPKGQKAKKRRFCVFDQSRECGLGNTACHVDNRPCSSKRNYLNKSFGVYKGEIDNNFADDGNSEQVRTRNDKHKPPMNPNNPPTAMKFQTISSRRHQAVDLDMKGKEYGSMDTYVITKHGTPSIILDLEKLSKDLGSYVLPHPYTRSDVPAVNFMHNSVKVASRVTDLFVAQVLKFFQIFS